MSDHLIAEANRHARALIIERDQLRAEAELAEQKWLKKCAVKRANELTEELAAEREKVKTLSSALQNLCDEQNGAPLERRRDQWQATMDEARAALAATEDKQ